MMLAAMFAGCTDPVPRLPPTYRYDEIRYWWEGEHLIVNVTFTNVANYSGQATGFTPYIAAYLFAEEAKTTKGRVGQETTYIQETGGISVHFKSDYRYPGDEWKGRWNRSGSTGPVALSPGETLQVEFDFMPIYKFRGSDGYHYFRFEMPPFDPFPDLDSEYSIYVTGCFNLDTPEFYGVKDGGPDCFIWDCNGRWTSEGYYTWRDINESYRENCTATGARPQYL